ALARLPADAPGLALVHLNHGMAAQQLGDFDEAETAFLAALEADPGLARAHELLGAMQLDLGESDGARRHLAAAAGLAKLPAGLLVELLVLHEQAGAWDEALAIARRLLQ